VSSPRHHLRVVRAPEISTDRFRSALATHPTGLVAVTGDAGGPVGVVATSFAQVSLNPPLVTVSVPAASAARAGLQQLGWVVVHLGCADLPPEETWFDSADGWTQLRTGEALLSAVGAWLRCRVEESRILGDHVVLVAQVVEGHVNEVPVVASVPEPDLHALTRDALGPRPRVRDRITARLGRP